MQSDSLNALVFHDRREAAERFLERSGDGLALRELARLRREREGWLDRLREAATSQTTLKIALGVFLGIVAAEAALSLMRSGAVTALLEELDARLAETGFPSAPEGAGTAHSAVSDPSTGRPEAGAFGAESQSDEHHHSVDIAGEADFPIARVEEMFTEAESLIADLGDSLLG
jgi:hypothetical protein